MPYNRVNSSSSSRPDGKMIRRGGCGQNFVWWLLFFAMFGFGIWLLLFNKPSLEITNQGFVKDQAYLELGFLGLTDELALPLARGLVFKNTSDHSVTLCLGKDQHCDLKATGPQLLQGSGITIGAHQEREITVKAEGKYPITIQTMGGTIPAHVNMLLDAAKGSTSDG
ncbi:hypothetical protein EPA93_35895 [Ktedonosporobacter rubrisoli]|uniref:Uncharacterized protein n=1 Tax=Ktedonosporobacter rubrisoli TaxID=2509675 RepID=A0A4P6JYY8_KTERU|nr:hypothetical protein [Ktedonosporobacter rubrisoli]QBD81068.1 hypothetical protein EPA93_35895 [Ktedonosporobacter rubrisoli]